MSGITQQIFSVLNSTAVPVKMVSQCSSEHSICFAVSSKDALVAKKSLDEVTEAVALTLNEKLGPDVTIITEAVALTLNEKLGPGVTIITKAVALTLNEKLGPGVTNYPLLSPQALALTQALTLTYNFAFISPRRSAVRLPRATSTP